MEGGGHKKRCTMGDVQSAKGDYDKSLIDQAFSFKMDGYWPPSCLRFIDLDFVLVHKNAKMSLSEQCSQFDMREGLQ